MFQEQAGNPITHIDIPASQNTTAIYAGAEVKGARIPRRRGCGCPSSTPRGPLDL